MEISFGIMTGSVLDASFFQSLAQLNDVSRLHALILRQWFVPLDFVHFNNALQAFQLAGTLERLGVVAVIVEPGQTVLVVFRSGEGNHWRYIIGDLSPYQRIGYVDEAAAS